jgi:hypothetical protein
MLYESRTNDEVKKEACKMHYTVKFMGLLLVLNTNLPSMQNRLEITNNFGSTRNDGLLKQSLGGVLNWKRLHR